MKKRVLLHYMTLITVTVLLIEGLLFFSVHRYYYDGVVQSITNHAETSVHLYERTQPDQMLPLHSHARVIMELFTLENIELILIDRKGKIISSSTGILPTTLNQISFNQKVLQGEAYSTIKKMDGERVLSVYAPLIERGQVVGILQYNTSLVQIDEQVLSLFELFSLVGICILGFVFFIGLKLANSLVNPVKELTTFSEQMANGNFKERIEGNYKDELRILAYTLNHMADEIVKTDQLKHDFISSISHELRTPLTSITGWIETLGENISKEERELAMTIISKETKRLTALVEDLLDFSRLQSNRVTLMCEELNINSLLFSVIVQMKKRSTEKEITFDLHGGNKDFIIVGDENKLRQVFINILDNAIKFSDYGKKIDVTLYERDSYTHVIIKDEGPGIPKDMVHDVTNMFYKINPNKAGTGIGLAVCKKIMELHEGVLHLESKEGEGTEVRLSFQSKV